MEYLTWKMGKEPIKSFKKDNQTPDILALKEPNKELNFYNKINENKNIPLNSEREILNGKLNDRYLIQQITQNPFLKDNSYVKDLTIQEMFLRPKSSYSNENNT